MVRPTDYTPELEQKAREYLSDLPEDEVVHSVEGLARALSVTRKTIYQWAKEPDKEEFCYIVDALRDRKSFSLQNKALRKEIDGGVAKLLLGHEGYREAQDITTDGKALPTPILGSVKDELDK